MGKAANDGRQFGKSCRPGLCGQSVWRDQRGRVTGIKLRQATDYFASNDRDADFIRLMPVSVPAQEPQSGKRNRMDARRPQATTDTRRRRLLQQQGDADLLAEFEALAPAASLPAPTEPTMPISERSVVERVISRHAWKHACLTLAILATTGMAIWIELTGSQFALIPAAEPFSISRGLAGISLILSGQLALLIGWIRSHSTVDFSGRYRCWKWLAGFLGAGAFLWLTHLHTALPQLTRVFVEPLIGAVGAARQTVVVVPLAAVTVWVLSRVIPDMSRNRWSQILFLSAVVLSVARIIIVRGSFAANVENVVLDAVLLAAANLSLIALLLHSRFVLYICNDPPAVRLTSESANCTTPQKHTEDSDTPATIPLSETVHASVQPGIIQEEAKKRANCDPQPVEKPGRKKRRTKKGKTRRAA